MATLVMREIEILTQKLEKASGIGRNELRTQRKQKKIQEKD